MVASAESAPATAPLALAATALAPMPMGAGWGGEADPGRTAAAAWFTPLEPEVALVAGEPSSAGGALSGDAGAELATGRKSAP